MATKKPNKKTPNEEKAKKQTTKPAKDELTEDQLDNVAGGFHITKKVDVASPQFFKNCADGTH